MGQSVKSDTIPTNGNVSQNSDDVKHSLSDSNGRKLTTGQAEYFKDSKVRDENGNLKVMFRGDDAGRYYMQKKKNLNREVRFRFFMVETTGLEPVTSCV